MPTESKLRLRPPSVLSRASKNTSSVRINCRMSAIINENEDIAVAHESQDAASAVVSTTVAMVGSVSLVRGTPKNLPLVASPWLAEMETQTVTVADPEISLDSTVHRKKKTTGDMNLDNVRLPTAVLVNIADTFPVTYQQQLINVPTLSLLVACEKKLLIVVRCYMPDVS
ncbi:uncharacterized protein BDZ83DRAFT_657189 [Colletotrichum acutatum]|uniref:Uncharacterized protein n=1 Tax=Glomerella acutata TaxID=27357 RepID=A0AAD8XCD3_GLOAC|nr:uncharacterized protein BDZ83DRAFT_657189 [Colletotrichum acutatum]KAK1709979.1 hypothetical protein BDZ83DRAFT_657189 [Colletotrichum acutatum]